jgi:peptidylprolyl isomerase
LILVTLQAYFYLFNSKTKKMAQVKSGDKIKVHYHGKLESGETFDSSEGRDPLEFEVGSGMVIKGFDDGVTGMTVGEKKTVTIPFDEAYGPINPEMVIEMPKDRFPEDMQLENGMPLMMSDQQGQQFQVKIVEIKEEAVMLDANHPLAGKDLTFDLELVEIVGGGSRIIMP